MSGQSSVRYCPGCGARLARDNRDTRCAACQQNAREEVVSAPMVPGEFWETDKLREAFASWHMGRVVYAYRHHSFHGSRPLSQELVGGWLGITQAQLSRLENGPPIRNLDTLIRWAQILRIPAPFLWFALPEEPKDVSQLAVPERSSADGCQNGVVLPDRQLLVARWTPESSASLLEMVIDDGLELTPSLAVRLAHEWLVTEPPQLVEVRAGRQIGRELVGRVEQRVEQLRHMDDFVGGHDLYELVEKELCATIRLLKEAAYSEALGKRLLAAVADLCQLAGWVAADAGLHTTAERYYVSGIHAAHAADDAPLVGNIISWLSYLYSYAGNPHEAVLLAQTAFTGAKHRASATTKALYQQRIAWAYALAGETSQAEQALGQVEQFYEQRNPADDPYWVYWLSHEEIQLMAGRCYIELRQPRRAEPLMLAALDRYDETFAREVSFYTSWLAECYIQTEDIDEAATQASRTMVLARRVNSARATARVNLIRQRLRPYRHVPAVAEFEELWRQTQQK